jgi:hypothetical protein
MFTDLQCMWSVKENFNYVNWQQKQLYVCLEYDSNKNYLNFQRQFH